MYRTGTYVAFDGLGRHDPTQSDYRYYATLKAWNSNENIDFKLTDSHEKTYAVLDTSLQETLYSRIRKRLSASKNMLVIISEDTRYTGSVLSYEIEQAVDKYKIPLIIAYPGYSAILNVKSLSKMWPKALADRINNETAKAIHIAFKKDPIFCAVKQFTINGEQLTVGDHYYTEETYQKWGLLK